MTAAAAPAHHPRDVATDGAVGTFDVVASTVLLFGLAVAQPLLDLLGRNAEFFLARNAPTVDIVALGILLTVVIPLIVAGVVLAIRQIDRRTGTILHAAVLAVLGGVLTIQVIDRIPLGGLPGWSQIILAGIAGAGLAVLYLRSDALRSVLRWGALVPLVLLGLFLFVSATSQLVIGSAAAAAGPAEVRSPAPVVFLVFDEFPVSSLMDADGNLQESLYPNFARLARDGTWYRNAVSPRHLTQLAVPAILTGREPPDGRFRR